MHLHPFTTGGSELVNHVRSRDALKNLLENGFPVFAERPEWWRRTICQIRA